MGWKRWIIAGAALALAAAPAQAATTLVNGSFESIIAGWTADPSLVQTPGEFWHRDANGDADRKFTPRDGHLLGVIQAGPSAPTTIVQTFTTVGGVFSGVAAFLAEDSAFNDYGFVRLHKGGDVIELFFRDVADVGPYGYTGWTTFSAVLDAGTYTFEAGAANGGDSDRPSFLLVDKFKLAEVPEPTTWALMLTGFATLGAMLRRRRCYSPAAARGR